MIIKSIVSGLALVFMMTDIVFSKPLETQLTGVKQIDIENKNAAFQAPADLSTVGLNKYDVTEDSPEKRYAIDRSILKASLPNYGDDTAGAKIKFSNDKLAGGVTGLGGGGNDELAIFIQARDLTLKVLKKMSAKIQTKVDQNRLNELISEYENFSGPDFDYQNDIPFKHNGYESWIETDLQPMGQIRVRNKVMLAKLKNVLNLKTAEYYLIHEMAHHLPSVLGDEKEAWLIASGVIRMLESETKVPELLKTPNGLYVSNDVGCRDKVSLYVDPVLGSVVLSASSTSPENQAVCTDDRWYNTSTLDYQCFTQDGLTKCFSVNEAESRDYTFCSENSKKRIQNKENVRDSISQLEFIGPTSFKVKYLMCIPIRNGYRYHTEEKTYELSRIAP